MRTHGGLTERSCTHSLRAPTGKGREGKGIGREQNRWLSLSASDLCSSGVRVAAKTSRGVWA